MGLLERCDQILPQWRPPVVKEIKIYEKLKKQEPSWDKNRVERKQQVRQHYLIGDGRKN